MLDASVAVVKRRCRSLLLLTQATRAYQAGNKALAKDLGARGRAANERMKVAHSAASATIYARRNLSPSSGRLQVQLAPCRPRMLQECTREISLPHHQANNPQSGLQAGTPSSPLISEVHVIGSLSGADLMIAAYLWPCEPGSRPVYGRLRDG